MEMKDPQTNTAGLSFDADKQSEAEQNRRTKLKNQTENKTRKRVALSLPLWEERSEEALGRAGLPGGESGSPWAMIQVERRPPAAGPDVQVTGASEVTLSWRRNMIIGVEEGPRRNQIGGVGVVIFPKREKFGRMGAIFQKGRIACL